MKFGKILAIGAALLFLMPAAMEAKAASSGSLAAPLAKGQGTFGLSLGYGRRDVDTPGEGEEATTRRLFFKGAFGLGEGFDVYAYLGFSDLEYDDADFSGSLGELVGVGARYGGFLLGGGPARLVFDLQLEYFKSEDGSNDVAVNTNHLAAYIVREFGAAGRIGYFYPYAGLRYSFADYDNSGAKNFDSDDNIGLFGGADYFVNPNVFFSVEMHVFDEDAIYLSAGYRF